MHNRFSINHIAITTHDPEKLTEFYHKILNLEIIQINYYETSDETESSIPKMVRSIWLALNEKTILMIEKQESQRRGEAGYHLIALDITPGEKLIWKEKLINSGVNIFQGTDYTIYFQDPDGNKIGMSDFKRSN